MNEGLTTSGQCVNTGQQFFPPLTKGGITVGKPAAVSTATLKATAGLVTATTEVQVASTSKATGIIYTVSQIDADATGTATAAGSAGTTKKSEGGNRKGRPIVVFTVVWVVIACVGWGL